MGGTQGIPPTGQTRTGSLVQETSDIKCTLFELLLPPILSTIVQTFLLRLATATTSDGTSYQPSFLLLRALRPGVVFSPLVLRAHCRLPQLDLLIAQLRTRRPNARIDTDNSTSCGPPNGSRRCIVCSWRRGADRWGSQGSISLAVTVRRILLRGRVHVAVGQF